MSAPLQRTKCIRQRVDVHSLWVFGLLGPVFSVFFFRFVFRFAVVTEVSVDIHCFDITKMPNTFSVKHSQKHTHTHMTSEPPSIVIADAIYSFIFSERQRDRDTEWNERKIERSTRTEVYDAHTEHTHQDISCTRLIIHATD